MQMKEIQELSKIKQALDADEVQELLRLRAQNARLLEALETALAHGIQTREGRDIVRAAISEAERKE